MTPIFTVTGNSTATVVGDNYALARGAFTDAGSNDTPQKYTVAWGDGVTQIYFGNPTGFSHVYTTANTTAGTVYTPVVSVVTDDGTYSASATVTVGEPIMNVIQGDGTPMNHDDQHDMGAFIPINNNDDLGNYDSNGNPIPDLSYTTPQSIADPDLVQVTLQPLPASVGGTYTLSWNSTDFRVWTDQYKDAQLSSGATFSATTGHSVYLEALDAPQVNSDLLEEDWQGNRRAVAMVDHADTNRLTVNGPLNVPAYGTYSYSVSGGVNHNKANSFKITNGQVTGNNPSDSRTFVQWTMANAGTAGWMGKVDFILAEKNATYHVIAALPNVVNVVVTTPNNPFTPGHVTDAGIFIKEANRQRKQVSSGNANQNPPEPGLAWAANVALNGPATGNPKSVTRIKVGFIQNVTNFIHHGTYVANQNTFVMNSQLAGPQRTLDEVDGAAQPWYSSGAGNLFQPTDPTKNAAMISSSDRPFDGPYLIRRQRGGRLLTHMFLEFDFELDVAAETVDSDNGSSGVYVKASKVTWKFNGDGAVASGNQWKWTRDAEAVHTPPTAWGPQITTGETPVVTGDTFNQLGRKNDVLQ